MKAKKRLDYYKDKIDENLPEDIQDGLDEEELSVELPEAQETPNQKFARKITDGMSTWTFIITFLTLCVLEIVFNHIVGFEKFYFDPSTIILNLVLSLIAAVQGSIIMIAQKQADKFRDLILQTLLKFTAHINKVVVRLNKLVERVVSLEEKHEKSDKKQEKYLKEIIELLSSNQSEILQRLDILESAMPTAKKVKQAKSAEQPK